jgi:hypothetical protein
MKQIRFPSNVPTYDSLGRITAVGDTQLPRPANIMEQALSELMAKQSHLVAPLKAQTNHMDEAYNHMPSLTPQKNTSLPLPNPQPDINMLIQQALMKLYGGRT